MAGFPRYELVHFSHYRNQFELGFCTYDRNSNQYALTFIHLLHAIWILGIQVLATQTSTHVPTCLPFSEL